MIVRASFVACDKCGHPADVVVPNVHGDGLAGHARREAARDGFVRRGGQDLCRVCVMLAEEAEEGQPHAQ